MGLGESGIGRAPGVAMPLQGRWVEAGAEAGASGEDKASLLDAFRWVDEVGPPGTLVDAELQRQSRGHGGGDVPAGQDGHWAAGAVKRGAAAVVGHELCGTDSLRDAVDAYSFGAPGSL